MCRAPLCAHSFIRAPLRENLQLISAQAQAPKGPPYPPMTASLGGVPTVGLDVPICAVFLVLFIIGAVSHMSIFLANKKRSHKFIISGMMFGFNMARIVSCTMRSLSTLSKRDDRYTVVNSNPDQLYGPADRPTPESPSQLKFSWPQASSYYL